MAFTRRAPAANEPVRKYAHAPSPTTRQSSTPSDSRNFRIVIWSLMVLPSPVECAKVRMLQDHLRAEEDCPGPLEKAKPLKPSVWRSPGEKSLRFKSRCGNTHVGLLLKGADGPPVTISGLTGSPSLPDAAFGELSQESRCDSLDFPILAVAQRADLLGDPLRGKVLP